MATDDCENDGVDGEKKKDRKVRNKETGETFLSSLVVSAREAKVDERANGPEVRDLIPRLSFARLL